MERQRFRGEFYAAFQVFLCSRLQAFKRNKPRIDELYVEAFVTFCSNCRSSDGLTLPVNFAGPVNE